MAKSDREKIPDRLLPSLLDRLRGRRAEHNSYSIDEMYISVLNDLQALFSTHAPPLNPPEDCELLRRSVATYGLPDLTSLVMTSEREGVAVSSILEDILVRFEPRLRDVRVTPISDPDGAKQFRLRFQIEACLVVDPYPQVAFGTVLDLATGKTILSSDT